MAKKRRARPGDKAGRVVVVVVFVLMGLLAVGAVVAGVVYVATRPGLLPGLGAGPGGPSAAGFRYANTNEGLEKEASDLLAERQSGGDSKIREAAKLPETWFVDAFGADAGKEYASKYNSGATTPEQDLQRQLDDVIHYGPGKVHARLLEERLAGVYQKRIFFAMQKSAPPLYIATVDTGTGMQIYVKDQPPGHASTSADLQYFVYADGAWRYFVPLRIIPETTGR